MTAVDCQNLPAVYDWPPECGDYAPGGIIARRLRYIFEDTNGLFPASRKSSRAPAANGNPNKFNSIYELDFNGRFWNRKEFREPRPVSDRLKKRSKLLRPEKRVNSSTVFMNWQVPQRVLDNLPAPPADGQKSDEKQESDEDRAREDSGEIEQPTKLPALPATSAPPRGRVPIAIATPPPSPPAHPVRLPPRMERAKTWEKAPEAPPSSRQQPRRPATVGEDRGGKRDRSFNPVVAPRAAELLKQSNPVERRIIEKALLLSDGSRTNDTLDRALQPEAAVKMKKWLEGAQAEEREVVLKLFHQLGGSEKRGQNSYEKQELYTKMMNVFKSGHTSYVSQSHPHFSKGDGQSNLKHTRLLTPNTRKNFWMHTTWHHLPPYADKDRGENISSHYERPHKPIPRHFVIHPDGFGS